MFHLLNIISTSNKFKNIFPKRGGRLCKRYVIIWGGRKYGIFVLRNKCTPPNDDKKVIKAI